MSRNVTPEQKAAKAEYDRKYRAANKARIAENKRTYALLNEEKERARVDAWVAANRERSKEIKRAHKDRNPNADLDYWYANRTVLLAKKALYRASHMPEIIKAASLRRRGVSHATPAWADKSAIKRVYADARAKGLQVDHIVPLKGKTVCGLHVENNLQLLTKIDNVRKGNRYAD